MSEKRKPAHKFVASIYGKRMVLELFPVNLWPDKYTCYDNLGRVHYRLRKNGKWWKWDGAETTFGQQLVTLTEFFVLLRKLCIPANQNTYSS